MIEYFSINNKLILQLQQQHTQIAPLEQITCISVYQHVSIRIQSFTVLHCIFMYTSISIHRTCKIKTDQVSLETLMIQLPGYGNLCNAEQIVPLAHIQKTKCTQWRIHPNSSCCERSLSYVCAENIQPWSLSSMLIL